MKKTVSSLAALLILLASLSSHADSIVRIQCEDEDAGTEVFINDKFVGECPVDVQVAAGATVIRGRKKISADYEKVFEKRMRIGEGTAQRVELVLSEARMTGEAKARKEAAEAAQALKQAEAGDTAAMLRIAEHYDAGRGVGKDPTAAAMWRYKAEATKVNAQRNAAEAGDIDAMLGMAERHDKGLGVEKDPVLASAWRDRAALKSRQNEEARLRKIEQDRTERMAVEARRKAEARAKKIEEFSFFPITVEIFQKVGADLRKGDPSELTTATLGGPLVTVVALFSDAVSAPSATTELQKLKREATLRPSSWGKPDSMVAKAAKQSGDWRDPAEQSQVVAALK